MERILPLLLKLSYKGHPICYNTKEKWHYLDDEQKVSRFETTTSLKAGQVLSPRHALTWIRNKLLSSIDLGLVEKISRRDKSAEVEAKVMELVKDALQTGKNGQGDPWLSQLDWNMVSEDGDRRHKRASKPVKPPPVYWPHWYWEAAKPKKDKLPGTLDITVRNRIAPLLLRLSWLGFPLFHSREHGWIFRVPLDGQHATRSQPLAFYDDADK